ncbi:MAG: hypothetical protein KAQ99_10250 [Candidatus Aureabacteria bacterium]|nr:hypothetical protein [Candidatus Auribacterota bacterium]
MRTVKIPECPYKLFENIRDILLETAPWATLKESYSTQLHLAVFTFNDTRYIPEDLKPFMIEPPADMDSINEKMQFQCAGQLEEITKRMTSSGYISTIAGYGGDKEPE